MRKIIVIMNRRAGSLFGSFSEHRRRRFAEQIEKSGSEATLYWVEPEDMDAIMRRAANSGADIIAVGGGDGTLSRAAAYLAGSEIALGIIPAGTFNLIARDMMDTLGLEKALAEIMSGDFFDVDVAEANGHLFLHHVSIGIHPKTIEVREAYRQKLGVGKIILSVVALAWTLANPPSLRLKVKSDNETVSIHTPFFFIGNNRFETESFNFLKRSSVDKACLNVIYTLKNKPFELIRMIFQTFAEKQLSRVSGLRTWQTDQLTLSGPKKRIKMSLDGEIITSPPPINIRVRPKALKMVRSH